MVPAFDAITRRWLMRLASPYVAEIAAIAAALDFPGVWFLNGSYQWGCTSLARDDDAPWLVRTLDWPFPGLGRHVEIARMAGPARRVLQRHLAGLCRCAHRDGAGPLRGIHQPGAAVAAYAASVAAALDIMANALATWPLRHMPPDQLLRRRLRSVADYASAKQRLETTPIARPVIYTLAGCQPGERCVIERTERWLQHAHRGHGRCE